MIIYNPPFGLTKVTKEQSASITNHRKRNGIFQKKIPARYLPISV